MTRALRLEGIFPPSQQKHVPGAAAGGGGAGVAAGGGEAGAAADPSSLPDTAQVTICNDK